MCTPLPHLPISRSLVCISLCCFPSITATAGHVRDGPRSAQRRCYIGVHYISSTLPSAHALAYLLSTMSASERNNVVSLLASLLWGSGEPGRREFTSDRVERSRRLLTEDERFEGSGDLQVRVPPTGRRHRPPDGRRRPPDRRRHLRHHLTCLLTCPVFATTPVQRFIDAMDSLEVLILFFVANRLFAPGGDEEPATREQ